MRSPELAFILVGFGNVARRFLRLLDETADRLDFDWRVVAIATRHHGSVIDVDGLDPARALAVVDLAQSLDRLDPSPRERSGLDVVRQTTELLAEMCAERRVVMLETSVLNIERGEPATAHVRAALERVFLFEGVVMDGVPLFNLVRETMPAVEVLGFRGIINTTCQYLLTELERGTPFDMALAQMQARGIAEADPSLDVDGWDAAAKTAALVNVLMEGSVTPNDVIRHGIRDITTSVTTDAVMRGRRVRLIASASRDHGRHIEARVEPKMLDASDPLAALGDLENALYLQTDVLGEVGVVQRTSTLTQTAYALLSDVARISRRLREL
jgi:homoserine dehydrogenase